MPPAAVKLHYVASESDWPKEVRQISCLLSKPVSRSVFSGTYPRMTSLYSDLFDELESATLPGLSVVEQDSQPILGFLDIILETVSSLRRMQQDPHPFTMPIWSTLVRALCYSCYNDVEIFTDTPFILPRNFVESVCDGHALTLISFLYKNAPLSTSHSDVDLVDSNDSNQCPSESRAVLADEEGSDPVSDSQRDAQTFSSESDDVCEGDIFAEFDPPTESEEWPRRYFSSPPSKASSHSSLDMSFHAHILPGRGRRIDAVLPIICIADRENIVPLIGSVAYQRRVWGIEDPVVGIIIPRNGFSAQVILGWTDRPDLSSNTESPDDHTVDDLPIVHIAYSDIPCVANGVFNLTDPISAIAFSQFIVDLRDQYDKVVLECCDTRVSANTSFSWRSDLIDRPVPSDWEGKGEESVASWIRSVRTASSAETDDDPSPYPITPPPTQRFYHIPMSDRNESRKKLVRGEQSVTSEAVKATQSKKDQPGSRKGSGTTSTSSAPKSQVSGLNASSLNSALQSGSSGILSCSRFANKAENGIDAAKSLSITTYTYDRYIFSVCVALLPNLDKFKNQQHINEYVRIYESLTCFVDPGWQSMSELPIVEGSYLEAIKACFWDQLVTIRERPRENPLRSIDDSHQQAISERLSLLFWATLGAFSRGQRKSVNEAESRLQWNMLLFHVLNSIDSTGIHVRPLFERTILLSRNRLVDELLTKNVKDVRASAIDRSEDYYNLCSASHIAVVIGANSTAPNIIRSQELSALMVANYLLQQTPRLFQQTAIRAIHRRASSEPHTGTCDAVVVLTTDALLLPTTDCKIPKFITVPHDGSRGLFPPPHEDDDNDDVLLPSSQPAATLLPRLPRLDEEQPAYSSETMIEPVTLNDFKAAWKSSRNSFLTGFSETGHVVDENGMLCTDIRQLCDRIANAVPAELFGKTLFAILVVEHKKPLDDAAKALNQARAYVEAAVRLLQAHGITGLPVFALATNGNHGVVLMAWHSETTEKVYLIDRSVQRFNISSPIEEHPDQIKAANKAAREMAIKAERKLEEAKERARKEGLDPDKAEVHINWGWWKSSQMRRPSRSKELSKEEVNSKLEKVAQDLESLHLSS
ncbi:hypothetical protein DFS33DRAFT_1386464 [Desarmillaria ectypa]|nr:hypothetical protein DFS33DRAFT_1386464 [Desarmillaria ectypa]